VIVVLDLDVKPFTALKDQRFDRFDNRGTLEAHVSRSRVLEAGLLPPSSKDVAQRVKLDLLANVELDQYQHRPLQGLVLRDGGGLCRRCGRGCSGGYNGWVCGFHREDLLSISIIVYCHRKKTGLAVGR